MEQTRSAYLSVISWFNLGFNLQMHSLNTKQEIKIGYQCDKCQWNLNDIKAIFIEEHLILKCHLKNGVQAVLASLCPYARKSETMNSFLWNPSPKDHICQILL